MSFGDQAPFVQAIIESFNFYGLATLGDRTSTLIKKDQLRGR